METQTRNHLTFTLLALPLLAALAWYAFSVAGGPGAAPQELATHPVDPGRGDAEHPDFTAQGNHERTQAAVAQNALDSAGIHGRVLDPYGDPVGDALVGDIATPQPVATAADGRFQLPVELGDGSGTLLVLAADHAPFVATYEVDRQARSEDIGDIQLQRGGGIRGQVTDSRGKALPGATATLRVSGNSWPSSLDLMEVHEPATTAADGTYSFAHLMPGDYRVTASAPGRQTVRAGSSTQVMEGVESEVDPIVLDVGFELTGVVIDGKDAPVAGAAVRIRNGANQPRYDGRATTPPDGRFQMSALPPGPLRVEVQKPGFLAYRRSDVDASLGHELVVRLEGGLRVTGVAVDSRGLPVEKFAASIRRIGQVDPESLGSTTQQLRRQVDALRASAATATDPELQTQRARIATEFESRLERVRRQERSQPVATPANVGPVQERPLGKFAFDGLEEGLYAVGIASPDHQFAEVEPVEVRRGMPGQELRVLLTAGHTVRGRVISKHDGTPIAGATVELLRPLETSKQRSDLRRSLYPWFFERSGPQGVVVMTTRTGADGGFELRQAAPGRCFLSVRHGKIADHDTEAFYVSEGQQAVRVTVGMRASLRGRIVGIPPGLENGVEVIVFGGHGTMQTTAARVDGSYRFDDLQPGSYIVRAFPSDSDRYVNRLFGGIFPLWSGAVDPERIPPRDVTLAEGEARAFDLALDLPPAGTVQGTVTINGQPRQGGRAILRPVPGEAPGSGGQSLRAYFDDRGQFAIADVPAGNYILRLYGRTNQELYDEPLTVEPGATAMMRADLLAGGLRGRVTVPGVVSVAEIRGYVWVLPGAIQAPADVRAYRRTERANRVRVRKGMFDDDGLTPGPAVLIVDIRGWKQVVREIVIPAGRTLELDLRTADRLQ